MREAMTKEPLLPLGLNCLIFTVALVRPTPPKVLKSASSHRFSTEDQILFPFTLFPEGLIPNLTPSPNIKAKHCLTFDILTTLKKTLIFTF